MPRFLCLVSAQAGPGGAECHDHAPHRTVVTRGSSGSARSILGRSPRAERIGERPETRVQLGLSLWWCAGISVPARVLALGVNTPDESHQRRGPSSAMQIALIELVRAHERAQRDIAVRIETASAATKGRSGATLRSSRTRQRNMDATGNPTDMTTARNQWRKSWGTRIRK